MIPRADLLPEANVPTGARFWVPQPTVDRGWRLGHFQDVWTIKRVSRNEAEQVLDAESTAIEYLDREAGDADAFENLAAQIEYEVPDVPSDDAPSFMTDPTTSWYGLEQLEVGVAGLTYALNHAGLKTAASCRSHPGSTSWSEYPAVAFAAPRATVEALQPLVAEAGCGFEIDPARARLLSIAGPSIREMHRLAGLVLDRAN